MSRALLIALLVAVASSAATVLLVKSGTTDKPTVTEEQRTAREKFFGSGKELPSIKEGQEMLPRW